MENSLISESKKTFNTYSQMFEKTLKKVVFKNLIENAKNNGILDETMAREIIEDIDKMQDYEVASA